MASFFINTTGQLQAHEDVYKRQMVYDAEFSSQMEEEVREKSYSNYKDAVKRCSGWMADK